MSKHDARLLQHANTTTDKPFHVFGYGVVMKHTILYWSSFDEIGHALDFKDRLKGGYVTDRDGKEID